jgi:hypothetical protein
VNCPRFATPLDRNAARNPRAIHAIDAPRDRAPPLARGFHRGLSLGPNALSLGPRRLWLLFSAPVFALAFAMIWWRPPLGSQLALSVYYAIAHVVFYSSPP